MGFRLGIHPSRRRIPRDDPRGAEGAGRAERRRRHAPRRRTSLPPSRSTRTPSVPLRWRVLEQSGRADAFAEAKDLRNCVKKFGALGEWARAAEQFADYWGASVTAEHVRGAAQHLCRIAEAKLFRVGCGDAGNYTRGTMGTPAAPFYSSRERSEYGIAHP